ncbi:MAG: type II secretion system protein GspN, partial [Desulfuromonadales bacterium]
MILVSFLAGFYLFFPVGVLKNRIEQEAFSRAHTEVHIGELDLLFPPGLSGRRITFATGNPLVPTVQVSSLDLTPVWHTLVTGNPGVDVHAELMGGSLRGELRRNGSVEAQMTGVTFSEPVAKGSALKVAGMVKEGIFSGAFPLKATTTSRLDLTLDQLRLTGLEGLGVPGGTLSLGTVTLQGSGLGNSFRLDKLASTGGNLEASGSGTLLLAGQPARSRINLSLVLRPTPNLDKKVKDMLDLLLKPGRDGVYRFKVTGSLLRPVEPGPPAWRDLCRGGHCTDNKRGDRSRGRYGYRATRADA